METASRHKRMPYHVLSCLLSHSGAAQGAVQNHSSFSSLPLANILELRDVTGWLAVEITAS